MGLKPIPEDPIFLVGWVIFPLSLRVDMTYNVFAEMLNLTQPAVRHVVFL